MKMTSKNRVIFSITSGFWLWFLSGKLMLMIAGGTPGNFSFLLPQLAIIFNDLVSNNHISLWQRNLVVIGMELMLFCGFLVLSSLTVYYLLNFLKIEKDTKRLNSEKKSQLKKQIIDKILLYSLSIFWLEILILSTNFYLLSSL